jgi:PAT family beta-lactamase induction signal transducer AmpG
VDRYGFRAAWIVAAQAAMILCLLALAPMVGQPVTLSFWIILGIFCLGSATQDLAIDAYTIDFLETAELGFANGVRSGAYRFGSLAAGSGLLILSDWVGWRPAFVGIGVLFVALAATILVFWPFRLPRSVAPALQKAEQPVIPFLSALKDLGRHPYIWVILLFTLLYKSGDAMMGTMVIPFWKNQSFTNTEIGVVSGILGSVATTLGGLLGGWFTSRFGIGRSLWVLGIFQAVSNLGYWAAALPGMGRLALFHFSLPFFNLSVPVYPIYLASQGESLSSGLGYAPFMAFLMSLCDKRFSATQYAFFVFLSILSGRLMGFLGGFGVKYLGFASFFFMTFLVALPAFALLPWVLPAVRRIEDQNSKQ